MDLTGKTLGQYQIVSEIGKGGMATVYKAYQPSLERHVAVKVLTGDMAREPRFRQRFDREAKEAAKLSHPNILPVYDSGEFEGTLYIVTEFVEGGSLRDRMARPIEPGVAARIASEIAHALDLAHRHHLVHRDIKPGNILMTKDGRTLLADFGVAKVIDGTQYTQTGVAVGTPSYMSPEQARGEEVDGRSDLYSLGIMLYEMLVGRPPFQADTPLAVLHQQVTAEPPPPRSLNPAIPKRLERVILKSLAKSPGDRYQTGDEMAKALEGAVHLTPAAPLPVPGDPMAATEEAGGSTRKATPRALQATTKAAKRAGKGAGRALWGLTRFLLRLALVLGAILLALILVLSIGGAFVLGRFAERTIPTYADQLQGFTAYNEEQTITEQDLTLSVESAVEPFALDAVQHLTFDFQGPDKVFLNARVFGRAVRIQARVALEQGFLRVYAERLNRTPLYVVGGIISRGVNRGIEGLFRQAHFRLGQLNVQPDRIAALPLREAGVPVPTLTPPPTSSPTAGPTPTPFGTLELRNQTGVAMIVTLNGQDYVVPVDGSVEVSLPAGTYPYTYQLDLPDYAPVDSELTITAGRSRLSLTSAPTPPAVSPLPAKTKAPTKASKPTPRRATATPSATPVRTAYCPNSGARITSPWVDAELRGEVVVRGSAHIPGFAYYKLELGAGTSPTQWVVLGDLQHTPVWDGDLGRWDAGARPTGAYVLRLVVVDNTGNYKVCQVQVRITR